MNNDFPIIISLINYKGGTGKTAITVNLSFVLEFVLNTKLQSKKRNKKKYRFLLIDNDPQSSLTKWFYDPEENFKKEDTIYRIYSIEQEGENRNYRDSIIYKTMNPNIDLVPNIYLTSKKMDSLYSSLDGGIFRLKLFIDEIKDLYDFIFIDNNPSLTIFTKNSFVVSDYIIIPTEPTKMSVEGLSSIIEDINLIKKTINPNISILGILINRIDRRYKTHILVSSLIRDFFKDLVFENEIVQRSQIQNCERDKKPITYFKYHPSYKEFVNLSYEVLERIGIKEEDLIKVGGKNE